MPWSNTVRSDDSCTLKGDTSSRRKHYPADGCGSQLLPDIQAAPLWDSVVRKFVGIMVITDFIDTVSVTRHQGGPDFLSRKGVYVGLSDS